MCLGTTRPVVNMDSSLVVTADLIRSVSGQPNKHAVLSSRHYSQNKSLLKYSKETHKILDTISVQGVFHMVKG